MATEAMVRYLVPMLRAASSKGEDNNNIAYALQESLRYLAAEELEEHDTETEASQYDTASMIEESEYEAQDAYQGNYEDEDEGEDGEGRKSQRHGVAKAAHRQSSLANRPPCQQFGVIPPMLQKRLLAADGGDGSGNDGGVGSILELVRPYWSTEYYVDHKNKKPFGDRPVYSEPSIGTFEAWLSKWVRKLASQLGDYASPSAVAASQNATASRGRGRGGMSAKDFVRQDARNRRLAWLFLVLARVAKANARLGEFMLPYLVRDVLRYGGEVQVEVVAQELHAVLRSAAGSGTPSGLSLSTAGAGDVSAAGADAASASHSKESSEGSTEVKSQRSVQAAFSLLDMLHQWAKRHERSKELAQPYTPAEAEGALAGLEMLLGRVSLPLLSTAAKRMNAHARALQYAEEHLRQKYAYRGPADSGSNKRGGASLMEGGRAMHKLAGDPNRWRCESWIGAQLDRPELQMLQQIYSKISDEPDGLQGLAALRRQQGNGGVGVQSAGAMLVTGGAVDTGDAHESSLIEQALLHERAEEWVDALRCYEQALKDRQLRGQHQHLASCASRNRGTRAGINGNTGESGEAALHVGVVKALAELGHEQAVLHHVTGVGVSVGSSGGEHTGSSKVPKLLLPWAVQAAWGLSRWPLLSSMVTHANSAGSGGSSRQGKVGAIGATAIAGDNLCAAHDGFDVGLAKLILLAVAPQQRGQAGRYPPLLSLDERFRQQLETSRVEVLGGLAAASTESYQRAYPFLLQLHQLHEVEQGCSMLASVRQRGGQHQQRSSARGDGEDQLPLPCWHWQRRLEIVNPAVKVQKQMLALHACFLRATVQACSQSANTAHAAQALSLSQLEASGCLLLARRAIEASHFDTAASSLLRARSIGSIGTVGAVGTRAANCSGATPSASAASRRRCFDERLLMERARLLEAQGKLHDALLTLEPRGSPTQWTAPSNERPEEVRLRADKLLLATRWISVAQQQHGAAVLKRYEAVVAMEKTREDGYFHLGKVRTPEHMPLEREVAEDIFFLS
jgi:hypothetical protein